VFIFLLSPIEFFDKIRPEFDFIAAKSTLRTIGSCNFLVGKDWYPEYMIVNAVYSDIGGVKFFALWALVKGGSNRPIAFLDDP
jgi:hypothetical protein